MSLRWQVTFKNSPREDARAEELTLQTWGDKEGRGEPSDWSRPEVSPEEEDLECPPALNPLVQEFLSGEVPWAGDRMENDPQQALMPQPSSLRTTEWIHLHAWQLDMPAQWQDLQEVSDQDDIQEFCQESVGILSATTGGMPHLQSR